MVPAGIKIIIGSMSRIIDTNNGFNPWVLPFIVLSHEEAQRKSAVVSWSQNSSD